MEQKINVIGIYGKTRPGIETYLVTIPKSTKIWTIDDLLNLIPGVNRNTNSLIYTYHGLQSGTPQTKPLVNVMKDGHSLPLRQYGDITGYLERGKSQLVTGYLYNADNTIIANTEVLEAESNYIQVSDDLQLVVQTLSLKGDTSTSKVDAFDIVSLFQNGEEHEGLPLNPINETVVVDLAEDNQHIEAHLDHSFLEKVDVQVELNVKRFTPNKQMVVLGGEEIDLCKGLRVWIEFEYEGNLLVQCQDIRFTSVETRADVFVSTPIPNPQTFSDMIIVQYKKSTNELSLQTTGSAIPTIIKIIDVKGIL